MVQSDSTWNIKFLSPDGNFYTAVPVDKYISNSDFSAYSELTTTNGSKVIKK